MEQLQVILQSIPDWQKIALSVCTSIISLWLGISITNKKAKKESAEAEQHKTAIVEQENKQEELKEAQHDKNDRAQMWKDEFRDLQAEVKKLQQDALITHKEHLEEIKKISIEHAKEVASLSAKMDGLTKSLLHLNEMNAHLTEELEKSVINRRELNDKINVLENSVRKLTYELSEERMDYFIKVRSENPKKKAVPSFKLDQSSEVLSIEGDSYPDAEYAESVYKPLFFLVREYLARHKNLNIYLNMPHLNTVSTKYLLQFLDMLKESISSGKTIAIIWRYQKHDEDCLEKGEQLQLLSELQFQFQPFDTES